MKNLTPAILVLSFLALDASARSRVIVPASDSAARPAETRSIRELSEIAIAPVSQDPAIQQTNPVIASDGNSFLVVWRESGACCFWNGEDNAPGSLYAVRVSSRGEPSGAPRLVSSSALPAEPGLAFDGTHYLLLWYETDGSFPRLVGQRFSADATPVDAEPFLLIYALPSQGGIGLACGGNDCLALFSLGTALISKDGGVLQLDLGSGSERSDVIATEDGYAATLPIAGESLSFPGVGGGTFRSYLPAFAEFPRGSVNPIGPFEILARWQRGGGSLDPAISTTLASNGSAIVVAGKEEFGSLEGKFYVKPVPASRHALATNDPLLIVADPASQQRRLRHPEILWTGKRFLLVFESFDYQNPPTKGDVSAVWLAQDGGAFDGSIFNITSSDEVESSASLAVNERSVIALAFIRGLGEQAGSTESRLFVKLLSDGGGRSRPVRR